MPPTRLHRQPSSHSHKGLEPFGDQLLKVVVIGDVTVGKTSFIQRYVNCTYRDGYKATIGVDFSMKQIKWSDLCSVKLQLWDIAGQERFASVTRAYYRNADGCLLLFDLSNSSTFHKAARWKEDLDSKCRLADGSPVPCLLIANKSDLGSRQQVSREEIRQLCDKYAFVGWREVSVKENNAVTESINYLVEVMMGNTSFSHSLRHSAGSLHHMEATTQPSAKRSWCSC